MQVDLSCPGVGRYRVDRRNLAGEITPVLVMIRTVGTAPDRSRTCNLRLRSWGANSQSLSSYCLTHCTFYIFCRALQGFRAGGNHELRRKNAPARAGLANLLAATADADGRLILGHGHAYGLPEWLWGLALLWIISLAFAVLFQCGRRYVHATVRLLVTRPMRQPAHILGSVWRQVVRAVWRVTRAAAIAGARRVFDRIRQW
jgi:hypothetical protein